MSKLNKLTAGTLIGLGVLLVGYKLYKEYEEYKQEQVNQGNSSSNAGAFGDDVRFERDKITLDGNAMLQNNYASQSELQDVECKLSHFISELHAVKEKDLKELEDGVEFKLARTEGVISELLSQFEKLRQDVDSIDEHVDSYMYRWEV